MAIDSITQSRFPNGSKNRYPSEATMELDDYIKQVGDLINNEKPKGRPALVAQLMSIPNEENRSEAILAVSFHLNSFPKEQQNIIIDHAIKIFGKEKVGYERLQNSSRKSACKAIYHGQKYLEERHIEKLQSIMGSNPRLSLMFDEYSYKVQSAYVSANLDRYYPFRDVSNLLHHNETQPAQKDLADTTAGSRRGSGDSGYSSSSETNDPRRQDLERAFRARDAR
ncbi:hypothetical protein ACCS93_38725 [Rhizobium ruizarguesonis]